MALPPSSTGTSMFKMRSYEHLAVAATKSREEDGASHADQEDADPSMQVNRRRKRMQLAVPTAVMAKSLGYSKAAQYTTINRMDKTGAQVYSCYPRALLGNLLS